MSETLLNKVQEMLGEEKWSRALLNNYSTDNFVELDAVLKEARDAHAEAELKNLCDEHLGHTNTSIIALYLSGMAALSNQIFDDMAMENLITIFQDNHKANLVKYLCRKILEHGESKFALRTLAECCKEDNEEEEMFQLWERLVKADYEEADTAKALAEHYEKEGDLERAVEYYRKALNRYIARQQFSNVREIWDKLLQFCPEDIDFFLRGQEKIAKNFSDDKAVVLLQDVCKLCRARKDIDTAISLLKIILDYDEKDTRARRDITDCFREKYAGHSQLEEYIRISNLSQNWRNVHEAVTDFEKHIAFDKGNFVRHREWGVGRIAKVEGDEVVIDFARKRGHTMSLKMAVNALQTLSKDHIWVLKATWKKDALHDKVKGEIAWALKTVIRSFGNACDIKRIKGELCPSVLSTGEWPTWNDKAREILRNDSSFGVDPEHVEVFTVRERPVSREEKLFNEFKAERDFFERVQTIRNFAAIKNVEPDTEYFAEMFAYLSGYLKSGAPVDEKTVSSYLIVKDLTAKFPSLGPGVKTDFPELFAQIEDAPRVYENLKDYRLKDTFLKHIQIFIPGWEDIYLKLFPRDPQPTIITALEKENARDKLAALTASCFENYRESKEAAFWLFKNSGGTPWYKQAGLSDDKQLITLVHILDLCYKEIENHRDTSKNRKLSRAVYAALFEEGLIDTFLGGADQDNALRLYTLINDVKDLDPADKMTLKNKIAAKYPDIKFSGDTEKKVSRGLIVTLAMYEEKKRQLARLMTEEIPANSKEIEFALSLGDLRENAEYKAAKEKQTLLNTTVAKLQDEIDRAQVFDPSTVNAGRVSFGTKVALLNETRGEREEYTILGPWESDPENKVISYLSPFGAAVLNKAAGDKVDFAIGKEKIAYKVEKISPAV